MKNLEGEWKIFKTELIIEFMEKNGSSKTDFCKACRIAPSVFDKIMNQKMNFRAIAIFRIARVMKLQVYELLV